MPSSMSRPRRWKSTPARSYSSGWLPTPTPEDEAPAGELLERRRLLGDGRGPAQGELQDARAQQGPARGGGGDGERGEASPMGWGQNRWSTAHSESAPVASARRHSSASSGALPVPRG